MGLSVLDKSNVFLLLANRGNNVPKKVQEMEVLFQFMMNKFYVTMKRKEIR